jgi:predicted RNase H-like HicB family nuclease
MTAQTPAMNTTFGKCDRCDGVLPAALGPGQTWICTCGDYRVSMGSEPAQTPTPDNTRRETIEAPVAALRIGQAVVHHSVEDEGYIACDINRAGCSAFGATPDDALTELNNARSAWDQAHRAALASAEPQARGASEGDDPIPAEWDQRWDDHLVGTGLERPAPAPSAETDPEDPQCPEDGQPCTSPRCVLDGCGRPTGSRPPAAETEGLVERLTITDDPEKLLTDLADYLDAFESNMMRNDADMVLDACIPPSCWADRLRAQLAARTQAPADVTEALRWYFDMLEEQVHGHSAQSSIWWGKSVTFERHEQARRLLASTGSRQEPAGVVEARAKAAFEATPMLPTSDPTTWAEAGDEVRSEFRQSARDELQEDPVRLALTSMIAAVDDAWDDEPVDTATMKRLAEAGRAALRSQPASRESGEAMREAIARAIFEIKIAVDLRPDDWEKRRFPGDRDFAFSAADAVLAALPTSHSGSAS